MLKNESYDKIKILAELSRLCWFIEKHAKTNASQAGHQADLKQLEQLEQDLHKHIDQFYKTLCK